MNTAPRYHNALITGASSGLGQGLARALARDGIPVFLAARRIDALEQLRDELTREGHTAHVVALDVADTEGTVARLRELDRTHPLDLVIANAGVGANHKAEAPYAWEAMRDALHTNFCGAAATLTATLPAMVRRGRGHLVGIGSIASFGPIPMSASYCAPKAGLRMLLDCLRLDTVQSGVLVTSVHVGFVATPMLEGVQHPTPGLLTIDEAAQTIVQGIYQRKEELSFPVGLALAARAAGTLPRFAQKAIARAAARTIKRTQE